MVKWSHNTIDITKDNKLRPYITAVILMEKCC